MPGFTPHEPNKSAASRGLSQSERDCGVANGGGSRPGFLGYGELVKGKDILGNLRRYKGKESLLLLGRKKREVGLGEVEKRTRREKAVKMTSGSEVGFFRMWCCGGGACGWGGGGGGMSTGGDGGLAVKRR